MKEKQEILDIRKIGVIGCGTMGSGIAQTVAEHGFETLVYDVEHSNLQKGLSRVEKNWARMVEKNKMTPEQSAESRSRLTGTLDLASMRDCDAVIEAVFEDMVAKIPVFDAVDKILQPRGLILSNSSSLNISQLAALTNRQEQVCGMHFFNPAPIMKLVEVVSTDFSSKDTLETVINFAIALGKEPVEVSDKSAGFIANRLGVPFLVHAIAVLEEGVATKEGIDKAMVYGFNHPIGPIRLVDKIGLDVTLAAYEVIRGGDPLYCPEAPILLKKMIEDGRLGEKTGIGFYDYR